MKAGADMALILSRLGERLTVSVDKPSEYERYLQVCLEFIDFVFTPLKEKEQRETNKIMEHQMIEEEMKKIQRTLSIMDNKVPVEEGQIETRAEDDINCRIEAELAKDIVPEVEANLEQTGKQIEKINELLKSLN